MNRYVHHYVVVRFVWFFKWQLTFLQSTKLAWCLRAKLLNAIIITFVGNWHIFTWKYSPQKWIRNTLCDEIGSKSEKKENKSQENYGKKDAFLRHCNRRLHHNTSAFAPLNGQKSNKYCRPLIESMRSINVHVLFVVVVAFWNERWKFESKHIQDLNFKLNYFVVNIH